MTSNNNYYTQFNYRIIKKFSVQDHKYIKNYAKKGVYIYVIYETTDCNKFLYFSTTHYEDNTIIDPQSFKLTRITTPEKLYFNKEKNKFNEYYLELSDKKTHRLINLTKFAIFKRGEAKGPDKDGEWYFSGKLGVHTKKIAIDDPTWAEDYLKSQNIKSFTKKFEKQAYAQNNYNDQIKETFISTLFELRDNKFQTWNDHTIILDQGKTGKSSITTSLSKKCDNISIAGLYGCSNSKEGKFNGGLITTTKSAICVDEINELAENTNNDKILSILNTFLENGIYNYIKQFSAEIKGQNQFLFFGNLTDEFNFGVMLHNLVGNGFTFGRRIGMVIYNSNLQGYKRGLILPEPTPYMRAIKQYLSLIFNNVLYNTKFYNKIITHKLYNELSEWYNKELSAISRTTEEELVKFFINSHKETINRAVLRALKLELYNNLDQYINGSKLIFQNQLIYDVLVKTKPILEANIINFNNMVKDVNNSDNESNNLKQILLKFENENKLTQNMIRFFNDNKETILKGITEYSKLEHKQEIRNIMSMYKKKHKKPTNLIHNLRKYGLTFKLKLEDFHFYFTNLSLYENKTKGLFEKFYEDEAKESFNPNSKTNSACEVLDCLEE